MRFVDTSFWYALQNRRDSEHEQARTIHARGLGQLVTSVAVLGETWTLIRRRDGHGAAVRFLDLASGLPRLEVVQAGDDVVRDAWTWLRSHDEREYSFVDATSFALMRVRRIREALAFDGDFYAAGFVEVRAT
ncbi:MAG: PIN domain-containing protein [Candidatus Dormibacteraeota bacterium]|nr:PIN domain-containing protein [Candidatus Dormibacteraeota bacterium]